MTNNDILRRLRYALRLSNARLTALFALGEYFLPYQIMNSYIFP